MDFGASPPIWGSSHLPRGPFPDWSGQTLRSRSHTLRTLWDLRWHGENRAVAEHSTDPKVSACPLCHRYWSQAHVLCECSGFTGPRWGGQLDLTIAISQLPPGPMLDLGRQFQTLLSEHKNTGSKMVGSLGSGGVTLPYAHDCKMYEETNQSCFGTCTPGHPRHDLRMLATIPGYRSGAGSPPSAMPTPTPLADNQLSTIDWDPRSGEDHG